MPNNMGVVRYILALFVVIAHFDTLDNDGRFIHWPISYVAVGGFFALSGFLMAGSYLRRPNWKTYLASRCRRILPPYFATVIFFAVVLYFVSTAPDYFGSWQFWKYLICNLCFLNFLEPNLPGVFDNFEISAVNGSLWTMKVEWLLYISMPFASYALARCRKRPYLVILVIYIVSAAYLVIFTQLYYTTDRKIFDILSRQFIGQLMFFYSGVLIYYYFDLFMRWRWWILPAGAVIILSICNYEMLTLAFAPLVISFVVLWFSMVGNWGTWEGRKDNISYNIYLVHYPVCQLAALYCLQDRIGIWGSFLVVLTVTFIIAWAMNQLVEKPIRKYTMKGRVKQ